MRRATFTVEVPAQLRSLLEADVETTSQVAQMALPKSRSAGKRRPSLMSLELKKPRKLSPITEEELRADSSKVAISLPTLSRSANTGGVSMEKRPPAASGDLCSAAEKTSLTAFKHESAATTSSKRKASKIPRLIPRQKRQRTPCAESTAASASASLEPELKAITKESNIITKAAQSKISSFPPKKSTCRKPSAPPAASTANAARRKSVYVDYVKGSRPSIFGACVPSANDSRAKVQSEQSSICQLWPQDFALAGSFCGSVRPIPPGRVPASMVQYLSPSSDEDSNEADVYSPSTLRTMTPGTISRLPVKENLRYRTKYAYVKMFDIDISFQAMDIIDDCAPIDCIWLYGTVRRTGERGLIPKNHLSKIRS